MDRVLKDTILLTSSEAAFLWREGDPCEARNGWFFDFREKELPRRVLPLRPPPNCSPALCLKKALVVLCGPSTQQPVNQVQGLILGAKPVLKINWLTNSFGVDLIG